MVLISQIRCQTAFGTSAPPFTEIPAFEHYVSTLRTIAADAQRMADNLVGRGRQREKARAQHMALSDYATQLVALLGRALEGMQLGT